MKMKTADWWTACNSPYTGCPNLAIKPENRSSGCRSCWLPGYLDRLPVIHHGYGDRFARPASEVILHPERLAKCLRARKPQRYGWILGEPAEVARLHPEYLDKCADGALDSPRHGYGVPTSDPAGVVPWARGYTSIVPQNWIWLISASTQAELDARAPHAAELARMGWRVGLHLEPLLSAIDLSPGWEGRGSVEANLRDTKMWSWVAIGAPKGHTPSEGEELSWYRNIRGQCNDAGVKFWCKSPMTLDGREHRELPEGWPS